MSGATASQDDGPSGGPAAGAGPWPTAPHPVDPRPAGPHPAAPHPADPRPAASADGPARPRAVTVAWALAGVALLAAAVVGLTLRGDTRVVRLTVALPWALAACALTVGLVAVVVALTVRARSRRRAHDRSRDDAHARELAAAHDAARTAGRDEQRDQHRRFLARLDHELKNPVTAIRAVAASGAAGAPTPDAWASIDAQSRRLATLVRDLRKLAELETRPLELESVDLPGLVREAVDALAATDPGLAARLSLTVTTVPWPVPDVAVDRDLLAVAVDNILANAAKFSTDGAIEVRLREHDGRAEIEVADAGRGIPAAELPHVCDELARAANARDVPGSGLGLALVATVLRRHGGTVVVRSVEGTGTSVTLALPTTAETSGSGT